MKWSTTSPSPAVRLSHDKHFTPADPLVAASQGGQALVCAVSPAVTSPDFHGLTIPDCQQKLAAAPGGKEIIAESMLWLLLTGQVPTEAETRQLSRELAEKGELPDYIVKLVDSYALYIYTGT